MIKLKEMTFSSFLNKAFETLQLKQTEQLISWTKKIEPIDLLLVFEAAEELNKDRIYWSNSTNDFALLGIGSVQNIIGEENRFDQLEGKWRSLKEKALIYNPYSDAGTGLTALGGMDFDPDRPKSSLWEKYPTSQLTIPKYVIVHNKENFFIVINQYIDKTTSVEKLEETVKAEQALLLNSIDNQKSTYQKVISKKEIEPEKWKASVKKAVEEIEQQRARKIVLAREMRITLDQEANIGGMLMRLKETQPNSYIFAFEHGNNCFLGATPERLVQVKGREVLSTCLAGTAPRGETVQEDKEIATMLLHDDKNREEHHYVVQMIKNGIENYCDHVHIPSEPVIYPLRNLQHLFTPVTATLKANSTVFDIVKKLHPTPALGGVPREKALAFIREEELLDRGWYGAPIGWIDSQENSEFAVAIRSGLVQGNEVSLFAGCGVMRDSHPEMEYDETNVKFLPMLTILEDTDESY